MLEWSKMSLSDAGILASVKASDIVSSSSQSRLKCSTLNSPLHNAFVRVSLAYGFSVKKSEEQPFQIRMAVKYDRSAPLLASEPCTLCIAA